MQTFHPPANLPTQYVKMGELRFRLFIPDQTIQDRIKVLSDQIKKDYAGKNPLIICVLKGAILFLSDLMKASEIEGQIDFVRLTSYEGTVSTGNVTEGMSAASNVKDRDVLIVEDIVDTGNTLNYYIKKLKEQEPKSIKLAALLLKPEALKFPIEVDYLGFKIPNFFVVGYGLDYNEEGRGFRDIYQLDLPDVGLK